jgi:hypothetical protein
LARVLIYSIILQLELVVDLKVSIYGWLKIGEELLELTLL